MSLSNDGLMKRSSVGDVSRSGIDDSGVLDTHKQAFWLGTRGRVVVCY